MRKTKEAAATIETIIVAQTEKGTIYIHSVHESKGRCNVDLCSAVKHIWSEKEMKKKVELRWKIFDMENWRGWNIKKMTTNHPLHMGTHSTENQQKQ